MRGVFFFIFLSERYLGENMKIFLCTGGVPSPYPLISLPRCVSKDIWVVVAKCNEERIVESTADDKSFSSLPYPLAKHRI